MTKPATSSRIAGDETSAVDMVLGHRSRLALFLRAGHLRPDGDQDDRVNVISPLMIQGVARSGELDHESQASRPDGPDWYQQTTPDPHRKVGQRRFCEEHPLRLLWSSLHRAIPEAESLSCP